MPRASPAHTARASVLCRGASGGMYVVLREPALSRRRSGCMHRPVKGLAAIADARALLAGAGQGFNGRVLALHETSIEVLAESTYRDSIRFGETVRVHGRS